MVLALVARVQSILEIHAGQDGKDIGLDKGHQNFEGVDCSDCKDRQEAEQPQSAGKACKNLQNRVARHDVASQTNAVAHGAYEVGNQLDDGQDGAQRKRRDRNPEEAKETSAIFDKANNGDGKEPRPARIAVTAICEVVVKDIGIRPRKLAIRMNMNRVMI